MDKLKKNKGVLILTSIIILLPVLIGLILWNRLPERMATHWNMSGAADGYSGKAFAVFGLPLILLFVQLFCAAVTAADPKENDIGDKIFRLVLWICPAASLYGALLIYGTALAFEIDAEKLSLVFVGLLFVITGNYLPKCRKNYTVGIKLPWTLDDEENWNRTHRFAAWVWIIGGVLMIADAFLGVGGLWGVLTLCVIMALLPTGYSFAYYLKHK